MSSVTYLSLSQYVDMQFSDRAKYAPKHDNNSKESAKDYNTYKRDLNNHLHGERGHSLLKLVCADQSDLDSFNPSNVGMGFTASCPMALRLQIIAQHDYRATEHRKLKTELRDGKVVKQGPQNDDSIRVKNLISAILGAPLSLVFRVARLAIRTVFLPITFIYSLHQQHRYEVEGWAKEDLRRTGWEWIDSGLTFLAIFIGLINTIHPNAINLNWARDYYIERHEEAISFNQTFAEQKKEYLKAREQMRKEAAEIAAAR